MGDIIHFDFNPNKGRPDDNRKDSGKLLKFFDDDLEKYKDLLSLYNTAKNSNPRESLILEQGQIVENYTKEECLDYINNTDKRSYLNTHPAFTMAIFRRIQTLSGI